MALSDYEKQEIIRLLDEMERSRAEAVLATENSFMSWLKRAAKWLWDKIAGGIIGQVIGWLWSFFFG